MKNFVYLYCLTSELLPKDSRKQLAIGNTLLAAIFLTANIMEEIWKDIPGFEGYYQASPLGKVRRCSRFVWNGRNGYKHIRLRILKSNKNKTGYVSIVICLNGKIRTYSIHRIVALTFIKNPNNYREVNHINGIKHDNRVENLEWCTHSYNIKDELIRNNRNPINNVWESSKYNPINQFDMNGNFIKRYDCFNQIKEEHGYCVTHIAKTCQHKFPNAYNFKWEYANKD